LPAKNDNAVYLIHRGVAFAGKPRSYGIGFEKEGATGALFLWAPFGYPRALPRRR